MKFRLNKREQTLFFVTIGVVVLYIFYNFFLGPQIDRNRQLGQQVTTHRNELQLLKAKVETFRALEAQENSGQLGFLMISDFLDFVSRKAVLAGLELESLSPQGGGASNLEEVLSLGEEEAVEKSRGVGIEVQLKGTYLGCLEFLRAFEKGEVLATVSACQISGDPTGKGLNINLTFSTAGMR